MQSSLKSVSHMSQDFIRTFSFGVVEVWWKYTIVNNRPSSRAKKAKKKFLVFFSAMLIRTKESESESEKRNVNL